MEKKNVIEIQEEIKISQEDQDIILEKGDRIKVFSEGRFGYDLSFEKKGGEITITNEDTGHEIVISFREYEELYKSEIINLSDEEAHFIKRGFRIVVLDAIGMDNWIEFLDIYS